MLMLLPVLVGISIIAFALGIMSPGDPVDQVLNPNGNESYTQEEYDAMDEQDQERLAFEYGYSFSADEEDDDILFDED